MRQNSPARRSPSSPRIFMALASLLIRCVIGFVLFVALPPTSIAQGGPSIPKVIISKPIVKRIPRWDEFTGRFEPMEQVEVRPRVSGFIDQIHFTDGQIVKKDDILFTIDPRPYQIAYDSAQA